MRLQSDNKNLRDTITTDYLRAQSEISGILKDYVSGHGKPNLLKNPYVMDYNYLKPGLMSQDKSLPLTDSNGKFQYFKNIRNALESLLAGEDVTVSRLGNFRFPYIDKLQQ